MISQEVFQGKTPVLLVDIGVVGLIVILVRWLTMLRCAGRGRGWFWGPVAWDSRHVNNAALTPCPRRTVQCFFPRTDAANLWGWRIAQTVNMWGRTSYKARDSTGEVRSCGRSLRTKPATAKRLTLNFENFSHTTYVS